MKIPKYTLVYNRKTGQFECTQQELDVSVDDTVYTHYYVFRYEGVEFVVARIFIDSAQEESKECTT